MATYKAPVRSDEINKTLVLCKFCGSQNNKEGYVDDKHTTVKTLYCPYCQTAEKRREQDKENAKILKEKNGK